MDINIAGEQAHWTKYRTCSSRRRRRRRRRRRGRIGASESSVRVARMLRIDHVKITNIRSGGCFSNSPFPRGWLEDAGEPFRQLGIAERDQCVHSHARRFAVSSRIQPSRDSEECTRACNKCILLKQHTPAYATCSLTRHARFASVVLRKRDSEG